MNVTQHHATHSKTTRAIRALIWASGMVWSVLFLAPAATHAAATDVLDITITPYTEYIERDGSTRRASIPTLEDGSYQLVKRTQVGLQALPIAYPQQKDIVEISGVATPGSTVSIIVQPMNFALTSTVDDSGSWIATLPIDTLDAGIQNVLLVINDHGVAYSAPIAQFRIVAVQQLSNTTWLVIATVGSAMIVLLLAVNVRFYIQRKKEDKQIEVTLGA